ncbi:MAG: permease, partial [Candidatus Nephrothrix sp. EaCA]
MKILDRYIIKQMLAAFFYVVIILMVIITIIDVTENMDKFSEHHLSTGTIFIHYLTFIPWIAGMLIPITAFIAVVVVTSMMASRTEIIAMLSGGMSFRRFLFSYFTGASVIAVMSFFLNGWIIPKSNRELLDFKMRYLQSRTSFDHRNMHMQALPDVYLFLQNYNNQTHTGYQFTMERFKKDRLTEKITAEYIQWDTLKKKWAVHQWTKRRVDTLFSLAGVA